MIKIMINTIKELFKFGLFEDTLFSRFLFVIMNLIAIWSILGLIFISETKSDIILNLIQLICYFLFILSTYHRMYDYKETQYWIN